jgi:hypothetical protein
MVSDSFEDFNAGFNRSAMAYLDRLASDMRRELLSRASTLLKEAYSQDEESWAPLKAIQEQQDAGSPLDEDERAFLRKVRIHGIPLFLKNHLSVWDEVQVGTTFVDAVSCRLVEQKFVDPDTQARTMMHQWPIGNEMSIIIPVINKLPDDPTEDFNLPIPIGPDIFIKLSTPEEKDEEGQVTKEASDVLYAIGPQYCYQHEAIGDADFEFDLMMQDIDEFAQNLRLNNLNHEQLLQFLKLMVEMKRWPIDTYLPGVTTSEIAS